MCLFDPACRDISVIPLYVLKYHKLAFEFAQSDEHIKDAGAFKCAVSSLIGRSRSLRSSFLFFLRLSFSRHPAHVHLPRT